MATNQLESEQYPKDLKRLEAIRSPKVEVNPDHTKKVVEAVPNVLRLFSQLSRKGFEPTPTNAAFVALGLELTGVPTDQLIEHATTARRVMRDKGYPKESGSAILSAIVGLLSERR